MTVISMDEVTFKMANGNDWWFHAKGVPGSHVIVKSRNANPATEWDMPDEVFEAAACLAAVYSKNSAQEKAEVDYIRKKHVKRPGGGEPGFVVYYTNFSMMIETNLQRFTLMKYNREEYAVRYLLVYIKILLRGRLCGRIRMVY